MESPSLKGDYCKINHSDEIELLPYNLEIETTHYSTSNTEEGNKYQAHKYASDPQLLTPNISIEASLPPSMHVLTFSLNCYKIQFQNINSFDWITQQVTSVLSESSKIKPDLIAIAFQEFLPFRKAFVGGDEEYEVWIQEVLYKAISDSFEQLAKNQSESNSKKKLLPRLSYSFVKRVRHVGNALYLFSRSGLDILETSTACVGSGWLWLGNKGAVALRLIFRYPDREGNYLYWSLCFLSCHLDANRTDPAKRNFQFQELATRIQFQPTFTQGLSQIYATLEDQDCLILMGDLNYRVYSDKKSSSELIDDYNSGRFEELFKYDQLSTELENGDFPFISRFFEGKIDFPPTYKYLPFVGKLNVNRIPSWCDRILISSPLSVYRIIKYSSIPACKLSDHQPVYSVIELLPRPISATKRLSEVPMFHSSYYDPFCGFKATIGSLADYFAGSLFIIWETPYFMSTLSLGCLALFILSYAQV